MDNIILRKIVKQLLEGKSAAEVFLDETLDGSISLEKIKELELLVKNEQPVVKLQPIIQSDSQNGVGRPSVLNYDLPDSTSYTGLNYIILEHSKLNNDQNTGWFLPPGTGDIPKIPTSGSSMWGDYRRRFPQPIPSPSPMPGGQAFELYRLLELVAASSSVHPLRAIPLFALDALGFATGLRHLEGFELHQPFEAITMQPGGVYADLAGLVHNKIISGYAPFFNMTSAGTVDSGYIPDNVPTTSYFPKIMLVETYLLTSYRGDYGAGKTVKTFSLLPNEKTRITVKTWKTTEINFKQASSILDSWTRDSSDTFEKTITNENTNRQEIKESTEWHAEAEISGGFHTPVWGIDAKISGGTKGSSNSAREVFGKNVSNATGKQVANASSKRNVEVNTSQESKTITGEENLIERNLENVNAGRVLNFVFRQLHQEYLTYLHLVDVKLAFTNGLTGDRSYYREFSLNRIEKFLESYIKSSGQDEDGTSVNPRDIVRRIIVEELSSIKDSKGSMKQFIEVVEFSTGVVSRDLSIYLDPTKRLENNKFLKLYLRINSRPFYQNTDPQLPTYEQHPVKGIIINKNTYILPTDSVIIEALLGQAEALDKYSQDSRIAVIESQKEEIHKMKLGNSIIDAEDVEKADIWTKIYPPPPIAPPQTPQTLSLTSTRDRIKKNER